MSNVRYLWLPSGATPPDLEVGPFRAVIVVEQVVDADWRGRVSEWLVARGCLYMMAWGRDCSAWDDSVDWANRDAVGSWDIPEERFVMTTWHEKEPLPEVFWFAANCAYHPTIELPVTLVVHVAVYPREDQMLALYGAAATMID